MLEGRNGSPLNLCRRFVCNGTERPSFTLTPCVNQAPLAVLLYEELTVSVFLHQQVIIFLHRASKRSPGKRTFSSLTVGKVSRNRRSGWVCFVFHVSVGAHTCPNTDSALCRGPASMIRAGI